MNETIQKSNPIPENEPAYVPRVDVRETAEAFVVVADLPGADEKSVEATVQKRVLTIEGWTQLDKPQGGEELAANSAPAGSAATSRCRTRSIPTASRRA